MSSSLVNHPLGINHMLHFLLPLMFRACSDRSDAPKFHNADISYIVTFLANSIKPASKLASTMGAQLGPSCQASVMGKQHLNTGDPVLQNNNMPQKSMKQLKDLSQTVSLLGKMILTINRNYWQLHEFRIKNSNCGFWKTAETRMGTYHPINQTHLSSSIEYVFPSSIVHRLSGFVQNVDLYYSTTVSLALRSILNKLNIESSLIDKILIFRCVR